MNKTTCMLAVAALLAGAGAANAGTTLSTVRIASGLTLPDFVTFAPGDPTRLFVIEQRVGNVGRIRVIDLTTNTLLATPFLSVSPVTTSNEQGLLGLAFHPNYSTNGIFYVNYTTTGGGAAGKTVVASYRVSSNPNVADPTPVATVITVNQPQNNHNGGWLGFGPDGYLYIALGDGGGGNDTGTGHTAGTGNAQDTTANLLGKMLRLDVDGADNIAGNADDDGFPTDSNKTYVIPSTNPFVGTANDAEIWAYGLRNPWRNSFDRQTGALWIADVGQGQWEEVNYQAPTVTTARNYGWRCMEGNHSTGLSGCTPFDPSLTIPIWEYSHSLGCSITGGYVYRGCANPSLQGKYLVSDYCSATLWALSYDPGTGTTTVEDLTTELDPGGGLDINSVTSFGEDYYGELYIVDQAGEVFKIVPTNPIDTDGDGTLNTCEATCPADFDGSGFVDFDDFNLFVTVFIDGGDAADVDASSFVDFDDYNAYVIAFEAGC